MKDVPVGPCGPLKPGRPCTAIDKFSDFSNEIKTHIISIDWNKSFTLTLPPHLNSAKHPRVFLCCFETKTAWTQLRNKTPLKISIHRVIVVVSRYCLQSWYYLQRKKKKKRPEDYFFFSLAFTVKYLMRMTRKFSSGLWLFNVLRRKKKIGNDWTEKLIMIWCPEWNNWIAQAS